MAVTPQIGTEHDYRSLVEFLPQTLFEIDTGGRFIGSYSVIMDVTLLNKTEASVKQREWPLEHQTRFLKEANTALNFLLKKREENKSALETRMLSSVRDLVQP